MIAIAAAALSSLAGPPSGVRPVAAAGPVFTCTVTSVHDGDGPIRCAEGQKIRVSGIAAREIDESCTPHHPCPPASGAAAKAALDRLTRGQVLRCRQVGVSYDRVVADCATAGGADIACAMIGTGTVLRWPRYDPENRLGRCSPT